MIDAYAEACAAREAMHAAGNEYVRLRRQLGPVVGPQRAALDALSARVRDANLHLGMAITALAPVTSESMEVDVHGRLPLNRPKSQDRECHVFRPDADNVAKGVLDALSGAAYADDRQVTYLRVAKLDRTREDWPHVVVRVSGIGGAI